MADSGSSTWEQAVTLAVVAAVALAVGYGIKDWFSTLGDEPPIRVKNGSMELRLDTGIWEEDACPGNPSRPCAWRPSDGESRSTFAVVVQSRTVCAVPGDATIDRIALVYSDNKRFMLKPGNRQDGGRLATMVRPPAPLKPDPQNPAWLRYDAGGFVKEMHLDGDDAQGNPASWSCTFADVEDLEEACIASSGKKDACGP